MGIDRHQELRDRTKMFAVRVIKMSDDLLCVPKDSTLMIAIRKLLWVFRSPDHPITAI